MAVEFKESDSESLPEFKESESESLPESERAAQVKYLDFDKPPIERALGVLCTLECILRYLWFRDCN